MNYSKMLGELEATSHVLDEWENELDKAIDEYATELYVKLTQLHPKKIPGTNFHFEYHLDTEDEQITQDSIDFDHLTILEEYHMIRTVATTNITKEEYRSSDIFITYCDAIELEVRKKIVEKWINKGFFFMDDSTPINEPIKTAW